MNWRGGLASTPLKLIIGREKAKTVINPPYVAYESETRGGFEYLMLWAMHGCYWAFVSRLQANHVDLWAMYLDLYEDALECLLV